MSKQENKDKLRVYEYAKSLNMSSKEIITILKKLDIPVNNHMSVMENGSVGKVEQFFKDIKSTAASKQGNEVKPVATSAVRSDKTVDSNKPAGGVNTPNEQ